MSHRFYIPRGAIADGHVTVGGPEARHIATVLRLRPGDQVVVFNGSGREHRVELETVSPAAVSARVLDTRLGVRPGLHLTLVQSIPKGPKMDDIIRMGTEVGVGRFVPLRSLRVVAESGSRLARWRRIAQQAAKQSRRSDVPEVTDPLALEAALDLLADCDLTLVLWEGKTAPSIAEALALPQTPRRVALIVGPEGGLEPSEVAQATARGAVAVSLGPLVLRTQTAGIVAAAMVFYDLTLRRSAGPL